MDLMFFSRCSRPRNYETERKQEKLVAEKIENHPLKSVTVRRYLLGLFYQ